MSTIRTPVGPQPASVYWKRRAVVLLGLIAVIVTIVLIVVRPGSGEPTPTASPTPTTSTSTDPGLSAPACADSQLELVAVTDKARYNAGETPFVSMTITNTGAAACSIALGSEVEQYVITSGKEQYWSSQNCQTDAAAIDVVLEPGIARSTTPIAWDRTRSPEGCTGAGSPAPAGGASYHLTVTLGDLKSETTKQFLLF